MRNEIALVTGSSRGIGRAIARKLASEGKWVAINYKERLDCAESLLEEINAMGGRAAVFQADVSKREDVDRMFDGIESTLGGVDIVVSNAGVVANGMFQDKTPSEWESAFGVNVFGCFNVVNRALPYMLKQSRGAVVVVSSMWGMAGASCETVYSSTKWALIGFVRSLAQELARSGIMVNGVAPGVIDTDMTAVLGKETLSALAADTPVGRLGTPEDIANAVAFLCDRRNNFISGQTLRVDGGFLN